LRVLCLGTGKRRLMLGRRKEGRLSGFIWNIELFMRIVVEFCVLCLFSLSELYLISYNLPILYRTDLPKLQK
jgi:hypothetical protein